jgi:tetratricopeptide (TPR) repeat protein
VIAMVGAVATAVVLVLGALDGGTAQPAAERPPPLVVPSLPAAASSTPVNARATARSEHAQAMARLRAGSYAEAAELFARAAARDPGNAALATDLGFALGRAGRRAEAEAVLRGAIEKDPHRYYAYLNLAELLAEDPARWERRDAVVAFLDRGLDALKDDRKGRFNLLLGLAGFERAVGRTAAARARLQPLLAPEAPPLSRAQRKRVLDLLDTVALDERARALEDWPAPAPATARRLAAEAERFEAAERVDDAIRDLEIAVNLAPSNAGAWRALGRLLAAHGGALELDRADEALRQALTLEPAWSDLRELRAQIARRRAIVSAPAPRSAAPSEHARALYQQAEEWIDVGDPIGMGRDLVEEALADSPGFVAAALSLYALGGTIPQATLDALHDDGPGLWALADGVRKLGKVDKTDKTDKTEKSGAPAADSDALIGPWIDRAVALDVQEARFARAATRAVAGDRAGALADLVAYVAREPNPEHLAEARALRAGLGEKADPSERDGRNDDTHLSPRLLARIRLIEDRPDAALRALGGACTRELPTDRLVAIGMVYEYADQRAAARGCYEMAGAAGDRGALTRLARLDARLPDAELRSADRRLLEQAAELDVAAAWWALARLEIAAGTAEEAGAARIHASLALALSAKSPAPTDSWIPAAQAAERDLSQSWQAAEETRRSRRRRTELAAAAVALLAVALLVRRRWGGRTVEAALRKRPGLFPEVAGAIAELRHDVLKHRAGVIGAALDPQVAPEEIARALTEPRPTSLVVAGIYQRLVRAARGAGAPLRPLAREPVFGALCRELARAELLATRSPRDGRVELGAIDRRLRGPHADALDALLKMGPRARLDAATLSRWIAAVEAERRQGGHGWAAPGLSLADLDLDFPVELDALSAVFSNLLRNAQAAVDGAPEARVVIRADRERDVTGRQWVRLLVGDSAPGALTLESIESRESGRGLAIVRDLVRAWRGHLVVRPEPAPLVKLVGASFPL